MANVRRISGLPGGPGSRSQNVDNSRPISRLQKTWEFLRDESAIGAPFRYIGSGRMYHDMDRFNQIAAGVGSGWDGAVTPEDRDFATDTAGEMFGVAGLAMAGSMPFPRPANSVNIFIGPRAKNYPHAKAKEAIKMLASGVSPREVERATGAVFDGTGTPRFYVSDRNMKLTPSGETQAHAPPRHDPNFGRDKLPTISKQVHHPAFNENYPGLANDTRVLLQYQGGEGKGSFYAPGSREPAALDVYAPMTGPRSMMDIYSHELQHLIDYYEGAPSGANPEALPIDKTLIDHRFRHGPGDGKMLPAYPTYRMESGENWANANKAMRTLSPDEIAAMSVYDRMDHPPSHQWNNIEGSPVTRTFDPFAVNDPVGSIRPNQSMRFDTPEPPVDPAAIPPGHASVPRMSVAEPPAEAPRGPRRRPISNMGHNGGPPLTDDDLLRQAIETPRKTSARGGYVGAPPGIGTPELEQALIDDVLKRLRDYQGQGHTFYDDAQGVVRQWTDDPEMARRFASSSGHTSNQMSPLPNTTHAMKAMNQYAVGDPVKAGLYPNVSGAKAAESMALDQLSPDPKTGQYSYHLLPPEYRPADFPDYAFGGERAVSPGRAVHDTWDKEAFRYPRNAKGKQNAASDTEHLFMDRIYNKVARQVSRDPKLRAKYGTGPRAYETTQAALWDIERQRGDKFDVLPFKDIFEQNSGFTQMAAMPGPSTGIDPSFLNLPLDIKRQYTDDMFNAFSTPDGGNVPARALGMSPQMEEGFGPWKGMMEPNRTIKYGIGTIGSGKAKVIDPASNTAQRAVRDWNMIGLGQEGSGFTAPRGDGVTGSNFDLGVSEGVPLKSPQQHQKVFDAVEQVFGPGWDNNVVVQPAPGGSGLMLKNISGMPPQEFNKAVNEVHAIVGGIGRTNLRDVGNDFRYVQWDTPSAKGTVPEVWRRENQPGMPHEIFPEEGSYHRLFDDTRTNPALKKTFDEKVAPALAPVQSASEAWAAKMGLPANTVPDRVRRIITSAGVAWPRAMDEAVRKGIIPAFAAAALYGSLQASQDGGQGGFQ